MTHPSGERVNNHIKLYQGETSSTPTMLVHPNLHAAAEVSTPHRPGQRQDIWYKTRRGCLAWIHHRTVGGTLSHLSTAEALR